MSLIFERPDNGDPQTHALVIGVGGYRHLVGGHEPKNQVIPQIGILRQLTTAPRSAVDFTNLLVELQDHWRAPLGTVELLLSTSPGDNEFVPPPGFNMSPAGFDEIQLAYDQWRARCDANPDNIAIMYFCGHGVEKEEQFLLTEDFGKFPNNPWRGAFAFDSTQLAMNACKARTQLFFIDACREITDPMKDHEIKVSALETQDHDETESECVLVMKATAGKETALGPKKGVAYCTQALRRALTGASAINDGTGWVVRTGAVADKITDILGMVKSDQGFSQRCPCDVTKSTEIIRLPASPRVMLEVSCDPVEATGVARLSCQKMTLGGENPARLHESNGQPLLVDVEAGIYIASATFANQEFANVQEPFSASPPVFRPRLRCSQ